MTPAVQTSASLDVAMRVATVIVVAICTVAAAGLFAAGWTASSTTMRVLFFALAGSPIVLLLACAAFVPLGYRIADDGLWIERPIRSVRIPWQRIRSIREVELHGVVRTLGIGGFFGAWGSFASREVPSFRAYITKRHGLVCVELDQGDPIVLSPDEPAVLVSEVRRRLPVKPAEKPLAGSA